MVFVLNEAENVSSVKLVNCNWVRWKRGKGKESDLLALTLLLIPFVNAFAVSR